MKKQYKQLIQLSQRISEQLQTLEGRDRYWKNLINEAKKYDLIDLLCDSLPLDGDIIEFGVWRGDTTKRMAAITKNSGAKKRVYACDSFEGFGDDIITSEDTSLFRPISKLKKKFSAASDVPGHLSEFFSHFDLDGVCIKGYFNVSLNTIDYGTRFCFAHVDCDAYISHLDCLDYVYPKMVKGGYLVFDDYDDKKWPGATKAVDEFLLDKPENIKLSNNKENQAWYIKKE